VNSLKAAGAIRIAASAAPERIPHTAALVFGERNGTRDRGKMMIAA
jgi:hypothetical protein